MDDKVEGDQLDVVKRQIYGYWVTASGYRTKIHKQKVQVSNLDYYNFEPDFKSAVLELYYACEPKLQYHKETACVDNLKRLALVIVPDSKFNLNVAEAVLTLLTEFLEIDGVTKFEKDKYSSKPS